MASCIEFLWSFVLADLSKVSGMTKSRVLGRGLCRVEVTARRAEYPRRNPRAGLVVREPPCVLWGLPPCAFVIQGALCMLWFGDPHAGLVVWGTPCACCGGDPLWVCGSGTPVRVCGSETPVRVVGVTPCGFVVRGPPCVLWG